MEIPELFLPGTELLLPERMLEIEAGLARGLGWGPLTKLLSRKWGVALTSKALQMHYRRTQRQREEEELERKRCRLDYYRAFWE